MNDEDIMHALISQIVNSNHDEPEQVEQTEMGVATINHLYPEGTDRDIVVYESIHAARKASTAMERNRIMQVVRAHAQKYEKSHPYVVDVLADFAVDVLTGITASEVSKEQVKASLVS